MRRNTFSVVTALPDPPKPDDCPGTVVLEIYVPPLDSEDREESIICHEFSYHWLVAAGS